jgi:hypothetical protein
MGLIIRLSNPLDPVAHVARSSSADLTPNGTMGILIRGKDTDMNALQEVEQLLGTSVGCARSG